MNVSNYKKYRSQDLAKKFFHQLTNSERALATEVVVMIKEQAWKRREMVLESLRNDWKKKESRKLAKGESFDPNLHQAVRNRSGDWRYTSRAIVEVLQEGYKLPWSRVKTNYGHYSTIIVRI